MCSLDVAKRNPGMYVIYASDNPEVLSLQVPSVQGVGSY